jgi:hypothetical protein
MNFDGMDLPPERSEMRAFMGRRLAEIRYVDQYGNVTDREIEAQYLYYNVPIWYVLAWDRLRADVRFSASTASTGSASCSRSSSSAAVRSFSKPARATPAPCKRA